ncbi:hypothetical protein DFH09DRAFT_1313939 [Mycena vulgaris]|nr:hypothetical protein DFH09DRAFT_1313939 [Mycena vulgaris]
MQPHFPQELLDHIIDLLHENPVVLQACALVSRAYVYVAQSHIFKAISLGRLGPETSRFAAATLWPPPRDPHPPHLPLHQSSHLQFALHAFGDSRVLSSLGSTEACLWTKLSAALPAVGMLDLRSVTHNTPLDLSPFKSLTAPDPRHSRALESHPHGCLRGHLLRDVPRSRAPRPMPANTRGLRPLWSA